MTTPNVPSTMRAWQFSSAKGGMENNLKLNHIPVPVPKPNQHLVRILYSALNPVDYKPAEVPIMHRLMYSNPAIPGVDISAEVVIPAAGSSLKPGDLVFGGSAATPFAGGAMAEYAATPTTSVTKAPAGLKPIDAGLMPIVALTSYQTIVPHVKAGSRVFINGGSGGTGVFEIQIAKAAGAHVTTSCSTPNVELCKSLGADEVIDYREQPVLEALKKQKPFDHVVDNVGSDHSLYFHSHEFTNPHAKYIDIAGTPSFSYLLYVLKAQFLPSFLGGGKRKYASIIALPKMDQLDQVAKWMVEGKVRTVIDETFKFDDVPAAYRKIKTGRAKGKIVVEVAADKSD